MLPSVSCRRPLLLAILGCAAACLAVLLSPPSAWAADPDGRGAPVLLRPTARTTSVVSRVTGPLTALQLAARYGLAYEDARTYVMLEGRRLRLRIYPGTRKVVMAGREYTVKDLIERSGHHVKLSRRVTTFLSRQIEGFFLAEGRRQAAILKTRKARSPLPPLPRRRRTAPVVQPVRKVPTRTPSAVSKPVPEPPVARQGDPAWVPPAKERAWKWIVIHHSDDEAGSVAKYDRYHRGIRGWEHGCGYHFVIGNGSETRDGQVEWGPRWTRQLHGAHAKTPDNRFNDFGIGICLVGDFHRGGGHPSRAQMDALVRLTRWLMDRYDIDVRRVRGHCDCCATCCPGRNFPWSTFRRRLR